MAKYMYKTGRDPNKIKKVEYVRQTVKSVWLRTKTGKGRVKK